MHDRFTQPVPASRGSSGKARLTLGSLCFILALMVAPWSAATAQAAEAAPYPTKAITIVVGFPPGGPNDRLARELADHLSKRLKQPVVVETRPGSNSEIAASHVARAAPDGHTLLFTSNGALAVSPSLKADLPYDPTKDLAAIAVIAENPMLLVVSSESRFKSIDDLLAEARANPGKLTYASAGVGSPTQLAAELMKLSAKVDALHVPYKGGGPALVDLIGGQVDFYFGGITSALPLVRAGRLRALAITSSERSPQLPDVGTVSELALGGYEATLWYSVMAPADTPSNVIDLLYQNIASIMATPEMRKSLENDGSKPFVMDPEQFRRYLRNDTEKWAKVISAAHLNK